MKKKRKAVKVFFLCALLLFPMRLFAQEDADEGTKGETVLEDPQELLWEIRKELDFQELDDFTENELPQKMTFSDLVMQIVENKTDKGALNALGTWALDLFFYELSAARPLFIQMFLFAVLFTVVNRFFLHCGAYVSEMGFLMIYGAMMILLMQSFLLVGDVVQEGVDTVSQFLTALVPTYATTLMLSGNPASAGAFYEMVFALLCLTEWAMKVLLVPGIHIYVLLMMLDHLFEEEKLSKLAELLESGIGLAIKLALSGVVGLGVVQSLLTPARDRISQSVVLRSMTALPGVGNSIHYAEEVLLSCGLLIKNSVGTAGLILLLLLGMNPLIKVFSFTLLYRLLVAVLQPVADKRIVECMHGVAKGSMLYLKVMAATLALFLIAIAMVAASTGFV